MKRISIPLALIFVGAIAGCQESKNNANIPRNITKHLSNDECRKSVLLAPYFDKGFADAVMVMLEEIDKGLYGRDDVPGRIDDPELNIPGDEYSYARGFQAAHNRLSDVLTNGYINHEKYLMEKQEKADAAL